MSSNSADSPAPSLHTYPVSAASGLEWSQEDCIHFIRATQQMLGGASLIQLAGRDSIGDWPLLELGFRSLHEGLDRMPAPDKGADGLLPTRATLPCPDPFAGGSAVELFGQPATSATRAAAQSLVEDVYLSLIVRHEDGRLIDLYLTDWRDPRPAVFSPDGTRHGRIDKAAVWDHIRQHVTPRWPDLTEPRLYQLLLVEFDRVLRRPAEGVATVESEPPLCGSRVTRKGRKRTGDKPGEQALGELFRAIQGAEPPEGRNDEERARDLSNDKQFRRLIAAAVKESAGKLAWGGELYRRALDQMRPRRGRVAGK